MSVTLAADRTIVLEGDCTSDEAELLLQLLMSNPGAVVDWRGCTGAHSALIQIMMAAKAQVLGPPADPLLARWVAAALDRMGR